MGGVQREVGVAEELSADDGEVRAPVRMPPTVPTLMDVSRSSRMRSANRTW